MKRYKNMQINTHINILYSVTNSTMNYSLDLNRNTPRKDIAEIKSSLASYCLLYGFVRTYLRFVLRDEPTDNSTKNRYEKVNNETNRSVFCMLLRPNNHLLIFQVYFLMNFFISQVKQISNLISIFFGECNLSKQAESHTPYRS